MIFLQKEQRSRAGKVNEKYYICETYRPKDSLIDETRRIGEIYTKEFAEAFQAFIDSKNTSPSTAPAVVQEKALPGDNRLVKCGFKKLPKEEMPVERPKISHSDRIKNNPTI